MKSLTFTLATCSMILSGCYPTDKLTVFEDQLLTSSEMATWLGDYRLTGPQDALKNGESCTLSVRKVGPRYSLDMKMVSKDAKERQLQGNFLLCHIPTAKSVSFGEIKFRFTGKQDAILFTSPRLVGQDGKSEKNTFAILKMEERRLYVWVVDDDCPVAKGRIKHQKNVYRSEDIRAFLSQYTDAFTLANKPLLIFTKN